MKDEEIVPEDAAASFQQTAVWTLIGKTLYAVQETGAYKLVLTGVFSKTVLLENIYKKKAKPWTRALHTGVGTLY